MTENELSSSARAVQDALDALGLESRVIELPSSTRTAVEAAQAIGTSVAQIVKSIVFKGSRSGQALLVLASGVNRVSEERLAGLAGEPVEKADADFVRATTGFVIGGVPPLAHRQPLRAWIDEDLLQYGEVWAAAGTPRAVFRSHPRELARMSGGQVAAVKS